MTYEPGTSDIMTTFDDPFPGSDEPWFATSSTPDGWTVTRTCFSDGHVRVDIVSPMGVVVTTALLPRWVR